MKKNTACALQLLSLNSSNLSEECRAAGEQVHDNVAHLEQIRSPYIICGTDQIPLDDLWEASDPIDHIWERSDPIDDLVMICVSRADISLVYVICMTYIVLPGVAQ